MKESLGDAQQDIELMLESLNQLREHKKELAEFCLAVADSYTGKNKVVLCGVGKNALLSEMIAEFLHPYNIVAISLDPHRALHGNIGVLEEDDVLILSTKSGNTSELIDFCKALKNKMKIDNRFLICSNKNSRLATEFGFKKVLEIKSEHEASKFGYSPQTTILKYAAVMFAVVNALAHKKPIDKKDYFLNHQAGAIGQAGKKELEKK